MLSQHAVLGESLLVTGDKPIEVAVIGGGCGSMAAAFELSRPEHRGKYHVTVYQVGWRLGGKGASGRGAADRIEEHGLHIWLGFYENAFRLMRECYTELDRDPSAHRIAQWTDAFFPDAHAGVAELGHAGHWSNWTAFFPPADGLPGDPLSTHNPFTINNYVVRTLQLLHSLILGLRSSDQTSEPDLPYETTAPDSNAALSSMLRLVEVGVLTSVAAVLEAIKILEVVLRSIAAYPHSLLVQFIELIASSVRTLLEGIVTSDPAVKLRWEIIDLVIAIMVGAVRYRLLTDPRGLDSINQYECREWLLENGASESSVNSPFVRGLYDLALAYEDGDPDRPGLAAGQAIRGSLRMFFTYRGSLFWKMRAGMGDIVFAPFYEVLKRRGVTFKFFHRLQNVRLADPSTLAPDEKSYVQGLEFDVQAETVDGLEYQPLRDVHGVPSWPSKPDYTQLVDGSTLAENGWDPESHWDTHRSSPLTLDVTRDFDFVVLGIGVGAVPYVCRELVDQDHRWRMMVDKVKTVATQAFQIWMREEMSELGWKEPPITLSAFCKPFDTWADMTHLVPEESWADVPKSIAYFCNILADPESADAELNPEYPEQRHAEVRDNAIRFLNEKIGELWPGAVDGKAFRWDLLVDPADEKGNGQAQFDSQYWTANVNPSDRYVLALPGSMDYRISPLDNTYDNMTVAGDWTDCGFNEGCVEAAVMSGRLAAHAISNSPALEEIIGYDHP